MKFFLMLFLTFCSTFIIHAEFDEFGDNESVREAYKKCLKKYPILAQDISPFKYALFTQNKKLIKEMIERGVKVDRNAIACFAISANCDDFNKKDAVEIVELLLKHGAPLDVAYNPNNRGPTALALFAQGGRLKMLKFMLEKGADINGGKSKSMTPLAYACIRLERDRNIETIKYLLEKGADVNKMGLKYSKVSPLMVVVGRVAGANEKKLKNISFLIDLLLEHGADPFVLDRDGDTVLDRLYIESEIFKEPVPSEIEKKLKKAMERRTGSGRGQPVNKPH